MPDEPDITARLQELEDRLASEEQASPEQPAEQPEPGPDATRALPLPAVEPEADAARETSADEPVAAAPATTVPSKKAAAKKALAKKAPAKKAPAKKAPVRRPAPPATARPVTKSPPRAAPVAVPDLQARAAAPVEVPPPAPVAAPVPAPRRGDPVVRVLAVLALLLLAAAAGLGAAALTESRSATWAAVTVVRLDPGPDPQTDVATSLANGMSRYLQTAGTADFTNAAANRAGVSPGDLRDGLAASQRAPRQIALQVRTTTRRTAERLAGAAGDALVEQVNLDEAGSAAAPGDRLSAAVLAGPSDVRKLSPSTASATTAGVLAAAAVLLVAGIATLLRVTRAD